MAIQQLIHTLNELDEAHRRMLEFGHSKKDAIMNNQIEVLVQVMNQESKIMKQIAALEEERVAACRLFLHEKGIRSQLELTITELTRLVFDPHEKSQLLEAQARLSSTLQQLKDLNDLNQTLAEQSLNFIDYSLDLLGGRSDQEATYQHPATKSGGSHRPGLFDTRA